MHPPFLTSTYLMLNNTQLDKNFRFNILRRSSSFVNIAEIFIKNDHFYGNSLSVTKGDEISISLQNDKEDVVTVFTGTVVRRIETNSEVLIEAHYRCIRNETLNETYMDTSLDKVVKILCPHLDYQAKDKGKEKRQLVVQGKKEFTLGRLLSDKYYYLDLNNTLIVLDAPKAREHYVVDDCVKNIRSNPCYIDITPFPKLEINDTVEFQGNSYIVRHITYNYLSKAQMTLGIEDYEAPPLAEESKPEEETETPKEETEPEEGDLFENPEKLKELQSIDKPNPDKSSDGKPLPDARKHLIDIAKAVYKDYQNIGKEQEFQKIYITSVCRSPERQATILSKKMRGYSGKQNMFQYYDAKVPEKNIGDSDTVNYLNAIQAYYDNTEPNTDRWKKIRESHQKEIMALSNLSRDGDSIKIVDKKTVIENSPRTIKIEELLTKYMTLGHKEYSFLPSLHVFPIGKAYVVDISIKGTREQTADKLFAENKKYYPDCKNTPPDEKCEAGYKSKSDGEPHIHLKLLKNYKS